MLLLNTQHSWKKGLPISYDSLLNIPHKTTHYSYHVETGQFENIRSDTKSAAKFTNCYNIFMSHLITTLHVATIHNVEAEIN